MDRRIVSLKEMVMGNSTKSVSSYSDGKEPVLAQKRDSKLLRNSMIVAVAIYVGLSILWISLEGRSRSSSYFTRIGFHFPST